MSATENLAKPQISDVTYVAAGDSMEGHLKTKGNVEVSGHFKGDITASGSVCLRSDIEVNVTAEKLDVISCTLIGDVHVSGAVRIDTAGIITGNVFANEIFCAGKVNGNLSIDGNSIFQAGAQVRGDISTATLTIERGAILNGTLMMKGDSAPEKAPVAPTASAEFAEETATPEQPVISTH